MQLSTCSGVISPFLAMDHFLLSYFLYACCEKSVKTAQIRRFVWAFAARLCDSYKKSYEPVHEISNNVVCATGKASDQPANTRSLIRAFASCLSIISLLSY